MSRNIEDIYKKYKDVKIFNRIYYDQGISKIEKDTVYIYCSVSLPEYDDVSIQKKIFNIETGYKIINSNIFQGILMFFSKNQYLGCYNDIDNILYLIDILDDDLIDEINALILEIRKEKIKLVKQGLKVRPKTKLMLDDRIYDMTLADHNLSFLDKVLNRTPERCLRKDGIIYKLILSNEQNIGLDSYKREIAEMAQKVIADYRQKYYNDTISFKERYSSSIRVPMPQFDPEDVVKSGLMMTSQGGSILYLFNVDIKVHSVISENNKKYVKLKKSIDFNNGLLIIRTNINGNVTGVKFRHGRRHFHVDDEDDVCLGSASSKISYKNIITVDDILELKDKIINMMSICNTSSMYKRAYRAEEMESLLENARPGSLENFVISDLEG